MCTKVEITIAGSKMLIRKDGLLHKKIQECEEYVEPGTEPDDTCNRLQEDGTYCTGTMQDQREGGCNCPSGMPPCGYCTTTHTECDECDEVFEYNA